MDGQPYQPPLQDLPVIWQVGLLLAAAVGLTAWAVGRLAAKGVCVVSGIVLGGIAALLARQQLALAGAAVWYALGGAFVAGVVSWLLFRLWVGVTAAAVLGVLIPGVYLVVSNTPLPLAPHRDAAQLVEQLSTGPHPTDGNQDFQAFYDAHRQKSTQWWSDRTAAERNLLIIFAAGATLIGLLVGLVGPYVTSSFSSSLVGGCLAFLMVVLLMDLYAPSPAGWICDRPRFVLVMVGLITSAGMTTQWMISRRKADTE